MSQLLGFVSISANVDPALDGAVVSGKTKTVVNLGYDPTIAPMAQHAAEVAKLFTQVETELKDLKVKLRVYGCEKRSIWNGANPETSICSVKIPYSVEVNSEKTIQFVTITLADSFKVEEKTAAKFRTKYPSEYKALFVEKTVKTLQENGEAVLKMRLEAAGMNEDQVRELIAAVVVSTTKIETVDGFEREIERPEISEEARAVVKLFVKQAEARVSFD